MSTQNMQPEICLIWWSDVINNTATLHVSHCSAGDTICTFSSCTPWECGLLSRVLKMYTGLLLPVPLIHFCTLSVYDVQERGWPSYIFRTSHDSVEKNRHGSRRTGWTACGWNAENSPKVEVRHDNSIRWVLQTFNCPVHTNFVLHKYREFLD